MKKILKKSISTGQNLSTPTSPRDSRGNRDNHLITSSSHHLITSCALTLFLLFSLFLAPLASRAQSVTWYTGQTYTLSYGQIIENVWVAYQSGTTVTVDVPSGTAYITGVITNISGFNINCSGNLVLQGNSTDVGGQFSMSWGTLQLGNNGPDGSLACPIVLGTPSTYLKFSYGNYDRTVSNVISGNGHVVKSGTGKVTLTGESNYTGSTNIEGGTLQMGTWTTGGFIHNTNQINVANANSVFRIERNLFCVGWPIQITGPGKVEMHIPADGCLMFNGASYAYTGSTTITGGGYFELRGSLASNIIINNGELIFNNQTDYTYPGVISGTGKVGKWGGPKTILTGENTYTGETYCWGTMQIGNGISGSINNTSNMNLRDANAILRFEPGGVTTFSKVISGAGKVEYKGGNNKVVYLTGNNTYTGTTTVEGGSLVIGNNTTTGAIAGNIIVNQNCYIDFDRSNEYTYSGVISGAGNLSKGYRGGTSKLILTGQNTYTGATNVFNGTLQIGNGTSGSINNTSNVGLDANTTFRFEPGGLLLFGKVISGDGKVEYKGFSDTKLLALTANNTYTGPTTVESGCLSIGACTHTGDVAGNIAVSSGAFIHLSRSNEYTYSGVISGDGNVIKYHAEKTTLTGANTYTGQTIIEGGKLILGATGSIKNSNVVIKTNGKLDISAGNKNIKSLNGEGGSEVILGNSTLTIGTAGEEDGEGEFAGIISGSGGVIKNGSKALIFTADNQYTGTTTINGGSLHLGNGVLPTGSVASTSIVINNDCALIHSRNAADYSYSGVISGTGLVHKYGCGKLTLNATNTYSGATWIADGTLALGPSGSIENSYKVDFTWDNDAKFDVSAGNKKIKNLDQWNEFFGHEVILGTKTLTLEEGYFSGKFIGSGGVTKTGAGTLILRGENAATGKLTLEGGTLELSKEWAGNFTQATGTDLVVKGNVIIGGTCLLMGGKMSMDLTQETPSKLIVMGAASATGITTLNITSNQITNYVLMQAASGLNNPPSAFTVFAPGMNATLSANGTQLLITVDVADATPPTPGTGINGTALATEATITWETATDNFTPKENLRYFVYQSSSNNITTAGDCETNGTLLNAGGTVNVATFTIKELTANTAYYFNVVVSDMAGNKAAYLPKELKTLPNGIASVELSNQITVYPNPTTGELTIELRQAQLPNGQLTINNVEIFDIYGRNLTPHTSYLTPHTSYDLTVFPAGIYFLKITTENGVVTKKVIKY